MPARAGPSKSSMARRLATDVANSCRRTIRAVDWIFAMRLRPHCHRRNDHRPEAAHVRGALAIQRLHETTPKPQFFGLLPYRCRCLESRVRRKSANSSSAPATVARRGRLYVGRFEAAVRAGTTGSSHGTTARVNKQTSPGLVTAERPGPLRCVHTNTSRRTTVVS